MTVEEWEALLTAQGGGCAVCSGPPMGNGRYHVDHCHACGKIRGLLCHKCNVALGMVRDSSDHLRRLIEYLGCCDHQVNSTTRQTAVVRRVIPVRMPVNPNGTS